MDKRIRRLLQPEALAPDWALLGFRILASASLLLVHGGHKVLDWQHGVNAFPDPFGVGPGITFAVAVVANIISPVFIALGLFTRPATLPVLATTLTGFFLIHWSSPAEVRDTPYIYSVVFLSILFLGPGRYALDSLVFRPRLVSTPTSINP